MCIYMCNLSIYVVVAFGHSCLLRFRRICIDIVVVVSVIWYLQYWCICHVLCVHLHVYLQCRCVCARGSCVFASMFVYESLQVQLQYCVFLWVFVGLCACDLGGFDDCNFVIFMQQSIYIRVCIWCF